MSDSGCRADVWLWRARFFKTRTLAQTFVDAGRVRLTRTGAETRLDKSSRALKPGDRLVFVVGGRVFELTIASPGERRGSPSEARALYVAVPPPD